jgi:hypothetical protein
MKKLLLTLSFALISVLAVNAQTSADQNADGPKLTFSATTYDYGNITRNVPAKHEFKFTNTGTAPLIINSANPSCGCTVPTFTKEPIMPGKSGKIEVVYNAANPGNFTKSVTVRSNGGEVSLTIRGNVVEKKAEPKPPVVNPNK